MTPKRTYRKNETANFFYHLCKMLYFSGGFNAWFEDLEIPASYANFFARISKIIEVIMLYFIITGWGALYTQKYLTQQQINSIWMFGVPNTFAYMFYISVQYYKQDLRKLVFTLTVRLKELSNDEPTERMMIKDVKRFVTTSSFILLSMLLSNGIYSGVQSIASNATFTTSVPMWPDVEDRKPIASAGRVLHYIVWWIFAGRLLSAYIIILVVTMCISYQFKILYVYFENLNGIFEGNGSQEDKERRYEDAFKHGIKMHTLTLWCVRQLQLVGYVTFSSQVIIILIVLMLVMLQMTYTERTLLALLPIVFTAATVLIVNAFFIWKSGDITLEAGELPTAMFFSGWHNCQESSVRVRKMVTIAMTQAQEKVVIKCFGFIELSYEFYVSIVKSSYSLFSVIY